MRRIREIGIFISIVNIRGAGPSPKQGQKTRTGFSPI